jgi:hypothetical protein
LDEKDNANFLNALSNKNREIDILIRFEKLFSKIRMIKIFNFSENIRDKEENIQLLESLNSTVAHQDL